MGLEDDLGLRWEPKFSAHCLSKRRLLEAAEEFGFRDKELT